MVADDEGTGDRSIVGDDVGEGAFSAASGAESVGRVMVLPRSLAVRCFTIMHEACDRARESYQGRHAEGQGRLGSPRKQPPGRDSPGVACVG